MAGGVVGSIPKMWCVGLFILSFLVSLILLRFFSLKLSTDNTKEGISMNTNTNKIFWSAALETIWALMTNIAAGSALAL